MARSIFISQIRDTGNILAGLTTANLVEGSNLYFTNARVYSNVIALLPTLAGSGIQIQANGQINSNTTLTLASLSPFLTTSNVSEGSNLYYTNARVRSALSGGTGVSYDNSTGAISIGQNVSSTADVTFTNLTVSGDLVVQGNTVTLNASTVNIEDKNLLLANGAINAAAADGAGITIDGANANIIYVNATNSWNLNKDIIVTSNVTANIFNGNLVGNATGTAGTLSNFTTANLAEGSNLYFTNARAQAAFTGAAVLRQYVNSYKGNSQSNTIALVITPISNNYVTVVINGVTQLSNAYSVSGNVLLLSGFPATNADIDVRILDAGQPFARDINSRLFYGNGIANVASISNNFTDSTILVFENGIAQVPGVDYTASGGTLRFTTPPKANVVVEIRELPTISSNNIYTGGQNITIQANGQINATVQEQIHPFLLSLL